MAGINRIRSASALAALSISVSAIAQQAPAADPPQARKWKPSSSPASARLWPRVSKTSVKRVQVIESIVAEDIGKLPDNNVIEALQRVTGVQVTQSRRRRSRRASSSAACPTSPPPGTAATCSPASAARCAAGHSREAHRPHRRLQDARLRSARDRSRRPDRRAHAPPLRPARPGNVVQRARHAAGAARRHVDPNMSFLARQPWEGDDGRFGALFNVSYSATRWRDQSITAGAMVPFATPAGLTGLGVTRQLPRVPAGFTTPLSASSTAIPPILDCRHPTAACRLEPGSIAGFRHGSR